MVTIIKLYADLGNRPRFANVMEFVYHMLLSTFADEIDGLSLDTIILLLFYLASDVCRVNTYGSMSFLRVRSGDKPPSPRMEVVKRCTGRASDDSDDSDDGGNSLPSSKTQVRRKGTHLRWSGRRRET